jgi:hypothetical protein
MASVVLPIPFAWSRHWIGALVVATIASLALAVLHRIRTRPRGWVVAHAWGIERVGGGSPRKRASVRFVDPLGVTVLASPASGRAIVAVTTPTQTRFIGVRLEGAAASALLAEASIVADGDALAAHAHEDDSMSSAAVLALLRLIQERAPRARMRLYLSGTRGERIVLDGPELHIDSADKTRCFDLASPIEWRGFTFHETLGAATSLYQATWLRQGTSEIVLVAPLPSELLHVRGVAQPLADEPPLGELRTGIERIFMLPVRDALARAPRPARTAIPKRVSSPDLGA